MDRNHIFKRDQYQATEFFAGENDIDHIVTIANSNAVKGYLVERFDLENVYNVKNQNAAFNTLEKRIKFKRKETKGIEIKVSDHSPERAAEMAKAMTEKIEAMYKEYFMQYQRGMLLIMQEKINNIDHTLSAVEDSILAIRNQFGVYDQMLPLRGKQISNVAASNAQKAEGIELLQKFTSQKDQLIEDRDSYISLINEYNIETNTNHISLFFQVEEPGVETSPSSPILWLILAICFVAGIIFSSLLVIMQSYYQRSIAAR